MKKVLLVILDGFGEGKEYPGNAVTLAKTPTFTKLRREYPWALLKASGNAVGVPEGTQGGSEVGHFTIGAGRIVFQSLEEINGSIKGGDFFSRPAIVAACERVKKNKSSLHLLGMISDQGVHSHIEHLFALLELAKQQGVEKVYIHAITDGRDVPEKSATGFIKQIQKKTHELGLGDVVKFGTIVGRYYAMDRDSNWKRLQPAYDLLTLGKGIKENDPVEAISNAYKRGRETDYYIDPIVLDEHSIIKDEDAVIFWNFRSDRARELTWAFTGEADPKTGKPVEIAQEKVVRPLFVCMGPFSHTAPVVFPAQEVKHNLGEIISSLGLKQFRIAETQKYPHVTYFLNSQIETPFAGEERQMIESPKCTSYAEKPEMSARELTEILLKQIGTEKYAFIAANFANTDLVGHSGNLEASIKAVEVVDECLGKIIPEALKHEYAILITGDHGNIEYKIYEENGEPCPSHSKNPVPFFLITPEKRPVKKEGGLKDIAPTILSLMGIKKPIEMTGENLIVN